MGNSIKIKFPLIPGTYNVLFITIDSCRYDTALRANTPFLNSISKLRKAETLANYTLPAHISFFIGKLPILRDGSEYYLPGIDEIWRSENARTLKKSVAINFRGKTIIDYYINNQYQVIGAGGVSFFRNLPDNVLPLLFPKFLYFERPTNILSQNNVPRATSQFPLANIDKIVSHISDKDPFFLFINCPETHFPFDSPPVTVTEAYKIAIKKFYSVDSIKYRNLFPSERLGKEEEDLLLDAQKKSLEWIDTL